jgi:transcriptional regulator with XRE-family HTH domain
LKRLRAARAEARLSQRAVALALGKSPSYVAKSEMGERRVDVVELAEFARLYRKPIQYFMG